jgi:hypothetical protein
VLVIQRDLEDLPAPGVGLMPLTDTYRSPSGPKVIAVGKLR